jgi:hypothetical protein
MYCANPEGNEDQKVSTRFVGALHRRREPHQVLQQGLLREPHFCWANGLLHKPGVSPKIIFAKKMATYLEEKTHGRSEFDSALQRLSQIALVREIR